LHGLRSLCSIDKARRHADTHARGRLLPSSQIEQVSHLRFA
jgi:hypothetical protein